MGKKKVPTRHSSRGKRGKSFDKAPRPVVILAVEGATEREYLKALNQWRYRGAFAFDFCRNRDKSSLKNLIVSIKRKADDVGRDGAAGAWIVCDVDDNAPIFTIWRNGWLGSVGVTAQWRCRIPVLRRGSSTTARTSVRAGPQVLSLRNSRASGNGELMRKQRKFLSGLFREPTRPARGSSIDGQALRRGPRRGTRRPGPTCPN